MTQDAALRCMQRTQCKIEIDPILAFATQHDASATEGVHKLKHNATQRLASYCEPGFTVLKIQPILLLILRVHVLVNYCESGVVHAVITYVIAGFQIVSVEGALGEQLLLTVPLLLTDSKSRVEWLQALEGALRSSLSRRLTECLVSLPDALLMQQAGGAASASATCRPLGSVPTQPSPLVDTVDRHTRLKSEEEKGKATYVCTYVNLP